MTATADTITPKQKQKSLRNEKTMHRSKKRVQNRRVVAGMARQGMWQDAACADRRPPKKKPPKKGGMSNDPAKANKYDHQNGN
jgi:hypothetical protein